MAAKMIYLLIGQKGSGKSTIGSLMDECFGIKFLRVESWVKPIGGERSLNNESYLQEVFEVIERGVRRELDHFDRVVFESTGLTSYFDQMLINLTADYRLVRLKVKAEPGLCLERVRSRDQQIHINVSDDQVKEINRQVLIKNLSCEFEIDNNKKGMEELKLGLRKIIDTNEH